MSDSKMLHRQAMELNDEADGHRRASRHQDALHLYKRAFELEREAASLVVLEPSRSILHRSAAWLALEANLPREAERVASSALASEGISDLHADELREVLCEAQLRLSKPTLPPPGAGATLAITLKGGQVGFGSADPSEIVPRINCGLALISRTAERKRNLPFRAKGPVQSSVISEIQPRLVAVPGSFTVRFDLGGPQMLLWNNVQAIVDDILSALDLVFSGDEDGLRQSIPEDSYRQNFLALARRIAPDGQRVGLIAVAGGSVGKQLILRPLPPEHSPAADMDSERQEIVGELKGADGVKAENTITVVTEDGRDTFRVVVADYILEDIVRPCFGRRVRMWISRSRRSSSKKWHLIGTPQLLDE